MSFFPKWEGQGRLFLRCLSIPSINIDLILGVTRANDVHLFLSLCFLISIGSQKSVLVGEFSPQAMVNSTNRTVFPKELTSLQRICQTCANFLLWSSSIITGKYGTHSNLQTIPADRIVTQITVNCLALTQMLSSNTCSSRQLPCVILSALLKKGTKYSEGKVE